MADEFEAKTFVGDLNPPAKTTLTAPPPAPKPDAPITTPTAKPQPQEVRFPSGVFESPEGAYWISAPNANNEATVYLTTPEGKDEELGKAFNIDVEKLNGEVERNKFTGGWHGVSKATAMAYKTGDRPFFDNMSARYEAGKAAQIEGLVGLAWLSGGLSDEEADAQSDIQLLKMQLKEMPSAAWGSNPVRAAAAKVEQGVLGLAQMTPFLASAATESLKGGLMGAMAAPLAAVTLGGPAGAAMVSNPAGLASAMTAGYGLGSPAAIISYTARVEGGALAMEMKRRGFSKSTIRGAAPAAGLLIGALEVVGFKYMTAPMKRTFLNQVMTAEPVKAVLSKWYVDLAKEVSGEVAVEVGQDIIGMAAKNLSAMLEKNPNLMDTPEQQKKALQDTFIQSFLSMGILQVASHGAAASINRTARALSAAIPEGQTVSADALEKEILAENKPAEIEAKKLNDILAKPEVTPQAVAKKVAGNEDAKAALHAKVKALEIEMSTLAPEGAKTDATALTPETTKRIVEIGETLKTLAAATEAIKTEEKVSPKQVEPMLPVKEARTPEEFVERRHSEQQGVLNNLAKENKALEQELASTISEMDEREAAGQSNVALAAKADKLAEQIRANDKLGAEVFGVMPGVASEELAQNLEESGANALVKAGDLIQMERQASEKLANAKESYFKHGAAYAKREVKRVQAYIRELVDRAGLSDTDTKKFIAAMTNTQTIEQLEKNYPKLRDRIFALTDKAKARAAKSLLEKTLAAAKPSKVNGKLKGKLGDADTQAIVDGIRSAVKETQTEAKLTRIVEAEALVATMAAFDSADYSAVEHAKAQYRLKALRYAAGEMTNTEVAEFVSDVTAMVSGAKARALAELEAAKADRDAIIEEMIAEGLGGKELPPRWDKEGGVQDGELSTDKGGITGTVTQWFNNLSSAASFLARNSGKYRKTSTLEKVFDDITPAIVEGGIKTQWSEKLDNAMARAYGLGQLVGRKLTVAVRKLDARLMEVHKLPTMLDVNKLPTNIKISIDDAIKRYMERQDPTLADNFTADTALAYTTEIDAAIDGLLTKEDKAFGDAQLQLYRDVYKPLNTEYRKHTGVNLPFNPFYSPIRVEGYAGNEKQTASFDSNSDQIHSASAGFGGLVQRIKHFLPLAQMSSRSAYNDHINKVAHYIAFEAKVRMWNATLANRKFRAMVKATKGSIFLSALDSMVKTRTFNSREQALMRGFDRMLTNIMVSKVAAKPINFAKQFTSIVAFLEGVPLQNWHLWALEMARIVKNGKVPAEWADSPFVKSRAMSQTPEVSATERAVKEGKLSSRMGAVQHDLNLFMRVGDFAPIQMGGGATYAYLKKKYAGTEGGDARALAETQNIAATSQSYGHVSGLSVLQSMTGPVRLLTAFTNQSVQMMRKELEVFSDMVGKGRITKEEAARIIIIYHILVPMFFQWVMDGFDIDEENQKRAAFLGSFNNIPAFAGGVLGLYEHFAGMNGLPMANRDLLDGWIFDTVKGITKLVDSIMAGDLSDIVLALSVLSDPAMSAVFGIPTKPIVNTAAAVKTIVENPDQWVKSLKLAAGFSPFMIKQQDGGDVKPQRGAFSSSHGFRSEKPKW